MLRKVSRKDYTKRNFIITLTTSKKTYSFISSYSEVQSITTSFINDKYQLITIIKDILLLKILKNPKEFEFLGLNELENSYYNYKIAMIGIKLRNLINDFLKDELKWLLPEYPPQAMTMLKESFNGFISKYTCHINVEIEGIGKVYENFSLASYNPQLFICSEEIVGEAGIAKLQQNESKPTLVIKSTAFDPLSVLMAINSRVGYEGLNSVYMLLNYFNTASSDIFTGYGVHPTPPLQYYKKQNHLTLLYLNLMFNIFIAMENISLIMYENALNYEIFKSSNFLYFETRPVDAPACARATTSFDIYSLTEIVNAINYKNYTPSTALEKMLNSTLTPTNLVRPVTLTLSGFINE